MLTGRDSQPEIISKTALDARLAETLAQIELLKCEIAAGRAQRDQVPEAWDEWIASAEQTIAKNEDRAAQLRILIAQQQATDTLTAIFAA